MLLYLISLSLEFDFERLKA